jgi:hypothetical protein
MAHEPPKNVLIAEHYSREEWEKSYAFYEGLTEIGFFIGLLFGLFAFALALSLGTVAIYSLYLCSILNFVAFGLSIFLIADPLMIFERRLVGMERKLDYTFRGVEASSKMMDGIPLNGRLKQESFVAFGLGLILFSLASSLFFTPLPIFFSTALSLSESQIFIIYMSSSGGAIVGYFLIGRQAAYVNERKQMRRIVLLRSLLVFLLVGVVQFAISPSVFAGVILVLMGFAYASYYILMISLSMELIPAGRSGLFDVLVGLGGATGSFFGPYLASVLGYLTLFLVAGTVFLIAYLVLKIFS